MSDDRRRSLERAAQVGGAREREALAQDVLRARSAPVEHPGPPTMFASLALFLARADNHPCACGHFEEEHRAPEMIDGRATSGCTRCTTCRSFCQSRFLPRRNDPRDDPEFRDLLADAGEWEALVAWVVARSRAAIFASAPKNWVGFAAIARVAADVVHDHTKAWPARHRARAFRDAYPWGEKKNWPYKAWRRAVAGCEGRRLADARRKTPDRATREMFE